MHARSRNRRLKSTVEETSGARRDNGRHDKDARHGNRRYKDIIQPNQGERYR